MIEDKHKYINREISWLSFNSRVLQEAADTRNPLIERMKFLGIFSNNQDEFFRVRVATIRRMVKAGNTATALLGVNPTVILNEIHAKVIDLQEEFDRIFDILVDELEREGIFFINEKQLTVKQSEFVRQYFHRQVRPSLFPIMVHNLAQFDSLRDKLKDHSIYLAIRMFKNKSSKLAKHALIEIPTDTVDRFLVLPGERSKRYIILLDDIIRHGLRDIFSMFDFHYFEAYTFKITRDAELDIRDDVQRSFFEQISRSLKQREHGTPVRFVYDKDIPPYFLKRLIGSKNVSDTDTLIPGGRYHNFKDFMGFPPAGKQILKFKALPPLQHPDLKPRERIMSVIRKKDILLQYPYQSFNHFIDLLREASVDPQVVSVKICLYRLAKNSNVANALINAVRNGKSVTVVMELQARFDEKANIHWTDRLSEEGVRIIDGVPDLKVHAKVLLVARREQGQIRHYLNISTGNYNEATARIYSDHSFFTADPRLAREAERLFEFFEANYKTYNYDHFIVSPFYMRTRLSNLIRNEIRNARKGKEAWMTVKLNSLNDKGMIDLLYEASQAGVKIKLIVRGICSLIPGIPGQSDNIEIYSIVDRFLEHSRILVFSNGGTPKYFLTSGDWMPRNLDRRIEVCCPIYDKKIQRELQDYLEIQLADNSKTRIIDEQLNNCYKIEPGEPKVHAQVDFYAYLKQAGNKTNR